MGELTLVTGGARSGKSSFAEGLIAPKHSACYLATNTTALDEEMHQRIKRHQARRPAQWATHEGFIDLPSFISEQVQYDFFLLDCATMLTMNYFYFLMREKYGSDYSVIDTAIKNFTEAEKEKYEAILLAEWKKILQSIQRSNAGTIIVTNEAGLGIVPENALSRWFRDIYGEVNQLLGKEANAVYLVVSGIPVKIK